MTSFVSTPARTLAHAGLALLVGLGLLLAPGAVAHAAGEGDVTWTVRTASNKYGAERTSFNYTVDPGGKVDDALVIANHGTDTLNLEVYAADGYTTESGNLDLLLATDTSVAIGAWVAEKADSITVAPGESVEVPFTLSVPEDATPGDYVGGIITSLIATDGANGISVDRRLGVRIGLRVGGELKPSLAIENMHVGWNGGLNPFAGGDATIEYSLHNTGNTTLSASQTAGITGPFGVLPTQAAAMEASPNLLPGESWKVSVPLSDIPAMVLLTATATATPIIVDASGSTTPLQAVTATALGAAVPWMLLLIIAVLVAAAIILPRLLKRRRAQQQAREDARVQEAVEQALSGTTKPE